jgi:PAS domain S-box-containing protein
MTHAFRPFEGRVTFSWANELSFQEMLTRCAGLPPHSAILFAILSLDAKGVPQVEDHALTELHASANAPIFGSRSTQLGEGIVGGPLLSMEDLSHNTTGVALRLLAGEAPGHLRTSTQRLADPTFDWRELRRWHIDEAHLPSGSTVLFREPTAWQRYRRPVLALGALFGVQMIVLVGLVADLERRRRTERGLRESEGRLRLLSNAAPVMLWIAGPDKLRTEVNRAWLDFTGRRLEAELGSGWTDGVHRDDVAHCLETYNRAFDRREPFRIECRLRRHDGVERWILETGVPRFLADGAFAGYVGSAIDVTDLKLARAALSSLSQRLMQAQEQERASIARKLQDDVCQRMIALTMRLHSLSQTSEGGDDEPRRSSVEALSSQLADMARELLEISDPMSSSKLELLGLAATCKTFCMDLSSRHDVRCEFEDEGLPVNLPWPIALAVFRVMQEALGNAVKHAGARSVAVSLRCRNGEILLDVADQGVGFDPEAVMKARGLGLVAMRERLSQVDGECTIESQPGGGTRIRARVPVRDATA